MRAHGEGGGLLMVEAVGVRVKGGKGGTKHQWIEMMGRNAGDH